MVNDSAVMDQKMGWHDKQRVGYKQITSPRTAINSVPRDGRAAYQQIGFCRGKTGHFELRTGAMAVRIEPDARQGA